MFFFSSMAPPALFQVAQNSNGRLAGFILIDRAQVRHQKSCPDYWRIKEMYVHMFAFRLKPGVSEEQKDRMLREINALKKQIPGLLETHVGRNDSSRGQGFEIGGVMKFPDQDAMEAYNAHPAHQALLKWLVPLIDAIEVDFAA
jgi:hypothetical protein